MRIPDISFNKGSHFVPVFLVWRCISQMIMPHPGVLSCVWPAKHYLQSLCLQNEPQIYIHRGNALMNTEKKAQRRVFTQQAKSIMSIAGRRPKNYLCEIQIGGWVFPWKMQQESEKLCMLTSETLQLKWTKCWKKLRFKLNLRLTNSIKGSFWSSVQCSWSSSTERSLRCQGANEKMRWKCQLKSWKKWLPCQVLALFFSLFSFMPRSDYKIFLCVKMFSVSD